VAKSGDENDDTTIEFNENSDHTFIINPLTDMPASGVKDMIIKVYDNTDALAATFVRTLNLDYLVGDGSAQNPYWVMSLEHFESIENNLSANFIQKADITGVTTPISAFTGVYDGNGFSVTMNLSTTNLAAQKGFGLFAETTGCTIKNLTVKGSLISTSSEKNQRIGAIVGLSNGTVIIDNCVNYATVSAPNSGASTEVGGILGRCYKTGVSITNCKNYGTISNNLGYASGIAGMVGSNGSGTVVKCSNYGKVSGGFASGVAGLTYCSVKECSNFGDLTGSTADSRVTGIVNGIGDAITVEACFNTGSISGGTKLFAIVTSTSTNLTRTVTVKDCYALNSNVSLAGKSANNVAEITVSNSYAVNTNDEFKGNGVTIVTFDALKTTNISSAYTLLSDNLLNDKYNKDYEYPQLKNNLVEKDYVVPDYTGSSN